VPDDNFEAYLENNGMGNGSMDDYVFTYNIDTVTNLNIRNLDINDLTGIEDFAALETLICEFNNISTVDISNNTNLIYLDLGDNNLDTINLNSNPNLLYLNVYQNNLANLDVSQLTNLKTLKCSTNNLTSLDLTNNNNLEILNCYQNNLTELDVSNLTQLKELICFRCNLPDLNLQNNTLLEVLNCGRNDFDNIDLSNNPNIKVFRIDNSNLQTLNVDNLTNLEVLVCSNSDYLTEIHLQNGNNGLPAGTYNIGAYVYNRFNAGNCPNLTCIYVDNASDANAGINDYVDWVKDSTANFVEQINQCASAQLTYVPDDNFEAYLENNGMGNGVAGDDSVYTANISQITSLNVSNQNITDFTGLQDFTSLEFLSAAGNQNATNFNINNISIICFKF
jgi:Leucine-rich repeat (LRR) protein